MRERGVKKEVIRKESIKKACNSTGSNILKEIRWGGKKEEKIPRLAGEKDDEVPERETK